MAGDHKLNGLGSCKTARELLDMYFLDIRCALLETAATLDRLERSPGGGEIFDDPRLKSIMHALDLLKNGKLDRAGKFQVLFSEQ